MKYLPLKHQSQQLSSALSSAGYFKSHCCKQCGPRSDCSFRSSLIWVHTVCVYAKCKFEKFARRCSRRQKQTTFSDADFLGALRFNIIKAFRTSYIVNYICTECSRKSYSKQETQIVFCSNSKFCEGNQTEKKIQLLTAYAEAGTDRR